MAEKIHQYEMVEAFISRYVGPGGDKIVFANNRLREREIFRGQTKDWKGNADDGFVEFLEKNNISPETQIAIASDGAGAFAVIEIIDINS